MPIDTHFSWTEADQLVLDRHVNPMLPDRIFDAHAHLMDTAHYAPAPVPGYLAGLPARHSLATYRGFMDRLHGPRAIGGLFFGLTFGGDRAANTEFVIAECAAAPPSFTALGQMLVWPEMDRDALRAELKRGRVVGLKPYHAMAVVEGPTWKARIEDFFPEWQAALADEFGLTVTMHMVRDRALADPVNQASIRGYAERYPNMRWILAHAARGFNVWHTIEGIESLRGLPNVWFDTSAVTEAGAFEAIADVMGHDRLMYGSDYPVSMMRGRCVGIGDSFHWLYADEMHLNEKHTALQPVLIGVESLRAVCLAARRCHWTDAQIEDVFANNALRVFQR